MNAPPSITLPPPDDERWVPANGIRLHALRYGLQHDATPVVLIGGLGSDTTLWVFQVAALAAQRPVVTFDNRGAGRSDKPRSPYSIALLADDVAGLLNGLGIDRAHIVGASMGGFVAQAFAVQHPGRLDRLSLLCTSVGLRGVLPDPSVFAAMVHRDGDVAAHVRRAYRLFASAAWNEAHADVIAWFVQRRLAQPMPGYAYQRQVEAASAFDGWADAARIVAPTLVLHGQDDTVVPAANAALLAECVPHATARVLPGGHVFFMEYAEAVNEALVAFLQD
ncbi:MAG: alpha/beta fold hydrolase [Bacteroidota bacterium]